MQVAQRPSQQFRLHQKTVADFSFSLLQSTQSVFSKDARSTLFYYVAMFAGDKTIPAGQELTYDYGESHAGE